jgi:hypothetical protein
MSRKGRSARKAKAARQRASATARSNVVRAKGSPTADWLQPVVLERRNAHDACARLRELATARDEAQAAVELEVARLRGVGIGWVPIAAALRISRQGARQRYG